MTFSYKYNRLSKSELTIELFTIVSLIFAFIYVFIRAIILSITYDEAYTYIYVLGGQYFTGNNHVLNTIIMAFFVFLFGNSEIVIRIPALIGCFLYLLGIYRISKLLFKNSSFLLISVVVLILNPFLLDLFSLSRGYSLALGLMMNGLFF
ncbi:MAG: hypothetical protein ACTSUT_02360, partial [Promethearchaeota archaeon]